MTSRETRLCQQLTMREFIDAIAYSADPIFCDNYAVWQSIADFRRAFSQPEFQKSLETYPPGTKASPHLFQKIAVSNICVA